MRLGFGRGPRAALALALAAEGLQFFAIDLHPSWVDVGIDMAGAGFGMVMVGFRGWFCSVLVANYLMGIRARGLKGLDFRSWPGMTGVGRE